MPISVHLGALAFASVVFVVSAEASAADPVTAQVLFDEGKRLVASGAYSQACPKFEESQRLDPGMGTLYHLADCQERIGKTASAWAAYLEVAAAARGQGEAARAKAATERAAALEPRLSTITLDPGADGALEGLQILRDGAPIGRAQWSTAVPVDPGPHAFEARAAGKTTWSRTLNVAAGARAVVTLPSLVDAPAAVVAPIAAGPGPALATTTTTTTSAEVETGQRGKGDGQRIAGVALGVAGLAGAGVGAYFGVVSLSKHGDAGPHCGAAGCDAVGVTLRDDAHRAGNASTIAFAAGGAFVLAGVLTYVTAPRSSPSSVAAAGPAISIGPGGVSVRGTW